MIPIISAVLELWSAIAPHLVNTVTSCFGFSGIIESLHEKSKRLTDKASDVEKEVNDLEESLRKVRKTEVASWLADVTRINVEFVNLQRDLSQQNGFMNRFKWGQVIRLSSRFDELLQQHKDFHGSLVLDAEITRGYPQLITTLFGEAFKENVEKIVHWVVDENISMVVIYGFGGVGKTALAKHVHNHLLERPEYRVYWVTVSQDFNINKLQDDIAKVIGLKFSDENRVDQRAALLNQALSQKKDFVLILDDVWHNIDLEMLGNPLQLNGCKLIITTRSLDVCHRIDCHETIQVQTLPEEEAWNLFKEVFGQRTTLNREVKVIAKDVVKVCGGLPLGIITMAASMRSVTNHRVWKNTLTELKSSSQGDWEDKVFVVLKYSFDRLGPKYSITDNIKNGYTNLQLCFLYCSLYPEDSIIDKDELISKFISEKFIDQRKRRGEEFDLGHTMLDKLVNLCLLESIWVGGCEYVKMHDLLRNMAHKITRDNPKFKVLAGHSLDEFSREGEHLTKDIDKMSLIESNISEIPERMSPKCPKLSTLLLKGNERLKVIPNSIFLFMPSLCILDLSGASITSLPDSLSVLKRLNSLILNNCKKLEFVPCLGDFKELRELDLSETIIKEVPEGMENLVNLKYLSLYGALSLKKVPPVLLPIFQELQCLYLPPCVQVAVKEIESLKHLEMLSCRVEDVYAYNRIFRRSGHMNITSFDITIGHERETFFPNLPERLKDSNRITLNKCNLNKESLVAQEIPILRILECVGLSSSFPDGLQRLGIALRSIKSLEITLCEGIECIVNHEFSSLERIHLLMLANLMSVVNDVAVGLAPPPIELFSSLRDLSISHCKKIKKLGLGLLLDNLQNLKSICISYCDEIEEIIQAAEDERRGGVVSLPKLKDLSLRSLPKLKSICPEEAKMRCDSIKHITLFKCPNVKKLPLLFLSSVDGQSYSPPPNLLKIEIEEEMWDSLKWDDPTHKDILQPFVYHSDDDDDLDDVVYHSDHDDLDDDDDDDDDL